MSSDHGRMAELTNQLSSKSEKMRVLAKAGYERGDIARFLGTRYQFVRNVLVQDEARQAKRAENETAKIGRDTQKLRPIKLRLGPDGRVVIPAPFRDELGLSEGDTLIASLVDDELHLLTVRAAMRRAQAIVRQFVPEGVSLVDELLDDRRREVDRERQNG